MGTDQTNKEMRSQWFSATFPCEKARGLPCFEDFDLRLLRICNGLDSSVGLRVEQEAKAVDSPKNLTET